MIYRFKGEYRWLSNFASVAVEYNGLYFGSVEAAYQAAKSIDKDIQFSFALLNPYEAKQKGKTVILRDDWDDVKLNIMRSLLIQKFNKEPYKSLLINTGNEELVEGNWWNDTFWGICKNKGENHLGKLIMEIRETLNQ